MIKVESEMNFTFDNEFSYILEDDSFYNKLSSKYQTKDVDFIIYKNHVTIQHPRKIGR